MCHKLRVSSLVYTIINILLVPLLIIIGISGSYLLSCIDKKCRNDSLYAFCIALSLYIILGIIICANADYYRPKVTDRSD